mmetsp:Transcript_21834/g.56937  ORF Transcript_21834/g.56937 Transcript_21834/m.56937 type:complete len:221 (+) Transcript_21834:1029-1691(+)
MARARCCCCCCCCEHCWAWIHRCCILRVRSRRRPCSVTRIPGLLICCCCCCCCWPPCGGRAALVCSCGCFLPSPSSSVASEAESESMNCGSTSRARFTEKVLASRMRSMLGRRRLSPLNRHSTIFAVLLMCLIAAITSILPSSSTKSTLLRRMRSAKASCCTASFTSPPGWYSTTCCSKCLESTTHTMESSLNRAAIQGLAKKVKARGEGSARPVVSSRM